MKLSEERISHLSHLVLEALWQADVVDFADEGRALLVAKKSLTAILSVDDEVDSLVRQNLNRQKKVVGSREWQILYDKYFHEEMERRKW